MLTSFLRKKISHYDIADMSIAFSILSVCFGLFIVLAGGLLSLLNIPANVLVISGMSVWITLIVWTWISLVIIGRESGKPRVSIVSLTMMQIVCSVMIGFHWLFASSKEKSAWVEINNVFAFIILGFHVVYFTLAWGMKARVPLKTYVMFAVLVGLEWITNW